MKLTIETAGDAKDGITIHVRRDDPHEHYWFAVDEGNALRMMHEVAALLHRYFLFQQE